MRPRTPSIPAKIPQNHSQRPPPSWSTPLQDSLNSQPDFSLTCGKAWHTIPVAPMHDLAVEGPAQPNKNGTPLHASLELFQSVNATPSAAKLDEIRQSLSGFSAEDAAGIICTAALQQSNVVRHVCSLLCQGNPHYAKLLVVIFQQQFERRHCKQEVPLQYTLNAVDFLVRLSAVHVTDEQLLFSLGDALISDMLEAGQEKDQPLNEEWVGDACDCMVRLLLTAESVLPNRTAVATLENCIQAALGLLPLYQIRELVSRARAHNSQERPATVLAAAVAAAAAAAVIGAVEADPAFPASLKSFPFFPFDALDPPQDCISKISGLLSSKAWDEDEDGAPASTAAAPPALFWANGVEPPLLASLEGGLPSLPMDADDSAEYADLRDHAEKSRQMINALQAENQFLRQVAEAKQKEERLWQLEKARLQKEINFQRGSLRVLREVNAKLTQEVAELKLLGNRLLKEVKQKIINGYAPNGRVPTSSELATAT